MPILLPLLTLLLAMDGSAISALPMQATMQPAVAHSTTDQAAHDYTAYERQQHDLAQLLRGSSSPRDWALSTRVWAEAFGDLATASVRARAALLRKAAAVAPNDRLVQWFWAEASPDMSGCDTHDPCPERAAALARLEPDNGAAWMPVINAAWRARNTRDVDDAIEHMAAATHYDDLHVAVLIAWAKSYRLHFPSGLAAHEGTRDVFFEDAESYREFAAFANSESIRALNPLAIKACKQADGSLASEARRGNCARIGRLMLTHGNSDDALLLGMAFLKASGIANAGDQEMVRVVDWQRENFSSHASSLFDGNPERMHVFFADLERTGSEVQAQQMQLQRAGIPLTPPADWKPVHDVMPGNPSGGSRTPATIP